MSTTSWPSKVVPAQLSFLAIYNPSLGPTDETFQDQLVFYHSRAAQDARAAARRNARNDAAARDALRSEENEKLRQVGLAQGMVDFARSFSNGEPVESIETEKSRIVLHELESGWWILASIDLTRLPSLSQVPSDLTKAASQRSEAAPAVEYSSREVSPPALLIQQILQAHYVFCLHHGPSLNGIFVRLTREKFCNTLERFWTRFAKNWDVLLHGNPSADVFSGVKLASGGELGFGVGEEEWGSGEREVLEDLAHRTEGLVDLTVARFGEPADINDDTKAQSGHEELPWMGAGRYPVASDGIIFGGVGAVTRHSLRDVSLWMREIYTHGEQAYGVRDNPHRERRKRRKLNPLDNGNIDKGRADRQMGDPPDPPEGAQSHPVEQYDETVDEVMPSDDRTVDLSKQAGASTLAGASSSVNDKNRPNIPPSIVATAVQSSDKATNRTDKPKTTQKSLDDEMGTTMGLSDQYMKYLTFGLSTFYRPSTNQKTPNTQQQPNSNPEARPTVTSQPSSSNLVEEDSRVPMMTSLEPMPDGEALRSRIDIRKRQENRGHFVIGLKGDLLELDELAEDDEGVVTERGDHDDSEGSRIILRTIQIELVHRITDDKDDESLSQGSSSPESGSTAGHARHMHRVRVLLYVQRPFMYCFLFEDRTSSLQYTKFYKTLHRNLVPIHRPLLSSTSVDKVAERIESSHNTTAEDEIASMSGTNRLPSKAANTSPIFDLIYDPDRLTVHTSIPNIAEPGTPAAEGLYTHRKDGAVPLQSWTRIEALNVHNQILNTLTSVKARTTDIERLNKTSRGWWIVWLKIPPFPDTPRGKQSQEEGEEAEGDSSLQTLTGDDPIADPTPAAGHATKAKTTDMHRTAFLVRKAADATSLAKASATSSRAVSSMEAMIGAMSLGMVTSESAPTAGASGESGSTALSGGIGVNARKYVEGLLSLNR